MTTSRQDHELEQALIQKGLTAPRVTASQIDSLMARMHTHFELIGTSTFCHLFLDDKFYVASGHAACVSPANFDAGIGRKPAFEKAAQQARDKMWELEGYSLFMSRTAAPFIARVAHEVNRAYCHALGDTSQPPWDEAPVWQRDSAINGVQFHAAGGKSPSASHENWMAEKLADGWKYGPVKDPEKKEHPCMVPYNELPLEQRVKDYLFKAVVEAFTS